LKNNHIVYISWDGFQIVYSHKPYSSITLFKKSDFEENETNAPNFNKRNLSLKSDTAKTREFFNKLISKMAKGGPVKSYPDLSLIKPDVVNDTIMIPEFEIKEPNKIIEIDTLRVKKITNSQSATVILRDIWEPDTIGAYEQAYILYLNNANEVIGYYHHSSGGIAGTIMDVEMISAMAVKSLSRGVLIAHNHPSGNYRPSEADLRISKQLNDALALFNIPLLDSIIITNLNYYSLKDNGDL
jgi:proteasome lid subunit RPN8/RPN11